MPSRNPAQRLRDIAENIDAASQFIADLNLQLFLEDRKTFYAVVRALEIISEATRNLPEEIEARHPQIDWFAIRAAGNVFRHEYSQVDGTQIWLTATTKLPPLREVIQRELQNC
jgi:uncharacterized protein with HEPN domain